MPESNRDQQPVGYSSRAATAVLEALARCYEESKVGQTGEGSRDVQPTLEALLAAAGCSEGDARELAERQLREVAALGLLQLELAHRRDRNHIHKVRLSSANETAFYRHLGRLSPKEVRAQWSALFNEASEWAVGAEFVKPWMAFCQRRETSALVWQDMSEFRRAESDAGRETLQLVARLLCWREPEQFVRVASCRLCGDSKRLERQRATLEKLLGAASGGRIRKFADLRILDTPRHVLVAGPLRLRFADHTTDLSQLRDGAAISEADVERAEIDCATARCVTVENKTSFHQRTLQNPGDLHLLTSYPNAATLTLLRKLPRTLEFLHFGDSDPAGFDILRELREVTGLPIRSCGMEFDSSVSGKPLTAEEIRLLEGLRTNPSLEPERAAIEAMLRCGHKGVFEQENR